MSIIKSLLNVETKVYFKPYAISRIAIGLFFFITGANKMFNPVFQASMLKTITGIGFPYPEFTAHFTAFNECFFGLLLALGLFTRIGALVLNIVLFVALFTYDIHYHIPKNLDVFTWYSYFLYLPQVLYILFLFQVLWCGSGPYSIDSYLWNKRKNS